MIPRSIQDKPSIIQNNLIITYYQRVKLHYLIPPPLLMVISLCSCIRLKYFNKLHIIYHTKFNLPYKIVSLLQINKPKFCTLIPYILPGHKWSFYLFSLHLDHLQVQGSLGILLTSCMSLDYVICTNWSFSFIFMRQATVHRNGAFAKEGGSIISWWLRDRSSDSKIWSPYRCNMVCFLDKWDVYTRKEDLFSICNLQTL